MGRGILGALLAAVGMFVWGFLAWAVLELHEMKSFKKTSSITRAMVSSGDETGVYWIPEMPKTDDQESDEFKAFTKKHEEGPIAMVIYNKEGAKAVDPVVMAKGFAVLFLSSLLVAFLLARASIPHYMGRVLFCAMFGVFAAVYSVGSQWAFFMFPTDYSLTQAIDNVIAWTIAGAIMGAVVKPSSG